PAPGEVGGLRHERHRAARDERQDDAVDEGEVVGGDEHASLPRHVPPTDHARAEHQPGEGGEQETAEKTHRSSVASGPCPGPHGAAGENCPHGERMSPLDSGACSPSSSSAESDCCSSSSRSSSTRSSTSW